MKKPLILVGASVRAAAHSAVRAGFQPVAIDLFGDLDLPPGCPWTAMGKYPQGALPAFSQQRRAM